MLPNGYLKDVYEVMHKEGALCIADEVRASCQAAFMYHGCFL